MNRMNYAEIKDRAIELLKSGVIDNRSFDEIRHGESCIRAWCIRDALDRACREIEQQSPPPHHHRCVIMRKSDYRKAEFEIKRYLHDWRPGGEVLARELSQVLSALDKAADRKTPPD